MKSIAALVIATVLLISLPGPSTSSSRPSQAVGKPSRLSRTVSSVFQGYPDRNQHDDDKGKEKETDTSVSLPQSMHSSYSAPVDRNTPYSSTTYTQDSPKADKHGYFRKKSSSFMKAGPSSSSPSGSTTSLSHTSPTDAEISQELAEFDGIYRHWIDDCHAVTMKEFSHVTPALRSNAVYQGCIFGLKSEHKQWSDCRDPDHTRPHGWLQGCLTMQQMGDQLGAKLPIKSLPNSHVFQLPYPGQ